MISPNTILIDSQEVADESTADQVLYRNEKTVITRRVMPGSDEHVIFKQAFGAEAIRRLRHEASILERLAGVVGVVKIAQTPAPADSLALRDNDGTPLSKLLEKRMFAVPDMLELGRALAQTLAGVHRAGVIHKDITPSNVLISGPENSPTLIDFNIASSAAEERPGFTHQSHIAGTLRYMAPEQTGRTGRVVDQRADLYSLGVLLYEMVAGRPPFEDDDLLDLVHAHLVRVPTAPSAACPAIPPMLSDIIMRLLEKEPDCRYQTAEGLAHDLARLQAVLPHADTVTFTLGQQDFARHLSPPSRPIGREPELAVLQQSIDDAIEGKASCLLVAGVPGVGKSALINELRPMVAAHRGWFVAVKFDQYRQDGPKAAEDVMRALGRLLLAEPEDQLVLHRERIIKALGNNVGLGPAQLPEFVLLLGAHPRAVVEHPREAEARMLQACVDLLGSIATPERPVVLVLDDLQWAPSITLRLLDAIVIAADPIPGLLMVGVYRSNEVAAAHTFNALMTSWNELGVSPPKIQLENLAPCDIGTLIGQMLHLPPTEANRLAGAINERTEGNPYDTVELLNALRQDGLLVPCDEGWNWDASAIRQYVGDAGVVDILRRRIAKLSDAARDVLEVMACLGGDVSLDMLEMATGLSSDALTRCLGPSLEDGLLVTEQGNTTSLRFRHDRVQQAVFESMDPATRCRQHLHLARRLAKQPGLGRATAEQYLPAADALVDETECRYVTGLFQQAAARSRVLNYAVTERFLAAAIKLIKQVEKESDNNQLMAMEVEQHAALYGLGRLEEADAVYDAIVARCPNPIDLVEAAGVQTYSLISRSKHPEAMALGLTLLSGLGLQKPDDLSPAISAGMQRIIEWHRGDEKLRDFERPEIDDPRILACARLIVQTANAGYFSDVTVFVWLILEAHRLWVQHGPCQPLLSSTSCVPFLLVGTPQDYRGAYVAGRHMVKVAEARGYAHATSLARYIYGASACHWAEPIENAITELREAREGLLQVGDVTFGAYTYLAVDLLLDSAPTIEAAAVELDAGLTFAERVRNSDFIQRYQPRRQLVRALRGETQPPGSLGDDTFNEAEFERTLGGPSTTTAVFHMVRAMAAAIFGDAATLARHAAQAMPMLGRAPGYYVTALARVYQALALAQKASLLPPDERAPVLDEMDKTCLQWLTLRAADAPANFLHLLRWVEAERAWAAGDIWVAGAAFDLAMHEAAQRQRPWHRAIIVERAALFRLSLGMEHSARPLLEEACALYDAWGAAGKVREMRREHILLRTSGLQLANASVNSTIVSNDVVDMLAVLRASQALSSETSLARLTDRLGKVLGTITGATAVRLLVRPENDSEDWFLADSLGEGAAAVSVEQAGERGELALSAFRYTVRTRKNLVLDDATHDDRFSGDPYFAGLAQCSLLCAPILSHGELRGILILESRLRRAAFSSERMDAVMLIAGQMSVSLDNGLLYASLERKVAERTVALEAANLRLEQISRTDVLTSLANRRCFDEALDAEWLRAKRGAVPLGLAIIDIDFFKLYNDHYGHQGGDACLQLVARVLATGRRGGSDLVARYGGEEFVILLPDTDLEGAWIVADRVRAAVEALQEPHVKSLGGIVTVSIGVAAFVPGADSHAGQWVEQADLALYEAKRSGRNRVTRSLFTS